MSGNRCAILIVNGYLIADQLRLPTGTRIIRINPSNTRPDEFDFVVEHDDLDEVLPGNVMPTVGVLVSIESAINVLGETATVYKSEWKK